MPKITHMINFLVMTGKIRPCCVSIFLLIRLIKQEHLKIENNHQTIRHSALSIFVQLKLFNVKFSIKKLIENAECRMPNRVIIYAS